jgi:hypothetical protein
MTADELVIWSPAGGRYVYCSRDEITWLGRMVLSAGQDRNLHRGIVCAGLRYVARRWELFNRDTGREVYLTPRRPGTPASAEAARATPEYVLQAATALAEPHPVPLDRGEWLVGIGPWSVVLFVGVPLRDDDLAGHPAQAAPRADEEGGRNRAAEATVITDDEPPVADAIARVRAYFDTHRRVQMAMAYYYREFIRGKVAPQEVPMIDVAAALDLTNQTTIADYKKELQRLIWDRPAGHQRALAEFLINSGLIDHLVLRRAEQLAQANERTGKAAEVRKRFGYRQRRSQG